MPKLQVADLEVLFTANVDQVDKAEKQVLAVGKKIESNPIKVNADASPYEQAFAKAAAASTHMSKTLVRGFLESDRAAAMSADEIQKVLVRSYGVAEDAAKDLALAAKGELKIKADAKPALDSMDRVEKAARQLVSKDTALKLDADISRAEKSLDRTKQRLEDLKVRALGGLDVTADVKRAEAALARTQRTLDGLLSAKNQIDVEVNDEPAESGLKRFLSKFRKRSEDAGDEGGRSLSKGLDAATRGAGEKVGEVVGGDIESTLMDALKAIPIAGGIILAGVAIGKAITGAINDGLQVDVRQDRLQALTGITEAEARRLGFGAGEAYANNFGESIESNMDTARLALQFRIIDPKATTRDSQLVIQGLAGIADVLGEDVRPVATAVTQLLRTGLAKTSKDAFDILAAGARNGVNASEDMLDTFVEYPALFKRLGLSGEEALGLVSQGMKAGARNSDLAADALKEFQIRATDASETSAQGFKMLGLNAKDMTAQIAQGGQSARDGLDVVLDKLRETEDPVKRNAAAVALFGTQAEDLGDALFAMDLSNAVDQLDGVTGAAQRMFDTISDNTASKVEQAQRNIEVAADGIKGALALAFADPLGDFADWVSQNRGPVLQFFTDLINGAIDFGITATESFGDFVSGPLAALIDGIAGAIDFMNGAFEGRPKELDDLAESMRGFSDTTDAGVEKLKGMKKQFNDFAAPQVQLGYLNDASQRTAQAIAKVGEAADGSKLALDGIDAANIRSSESGRALDYQLRGAAASLDAQYQAALQAGESQEDLKGRYESTRNALIDQMVAMGLTKDQAQALIDTVLKTPEESYTVYTSNAAAESAVIDNLRQKIVQLPDGNFIVVADTSPAQSAVDDFIARNATKRVNIAVGMGGSGGITKADGGVVVPMAAGGSLSPMAPIAQAVPPNTWRVVGDRMKDREFYIPDDGSARSLSVLLEAMRSFGVMPMADGGIVSPRAAAAKPAVEATFVMPPGLDPDETVRAALSQLSDFLRG
ncbi:phage tail tape measure protein [Microbacterium sp.]|uniref:phage tail tape measure protein n=1 Tax=Microbacterium sp. TaxID=51671 RepID=UPI003A8E66D6